MVPRSELLSLEDFTGTTLSAPSSSSSFAHCSSPLGSVAKDVLLAVVDPALLAAISQDLSTLLDSLSVLFRTALSAVHVLRSHPHGSLQHIAQLVRRQSHNSTCRYGQKWNGTIDF